MTTFDAKSTEPETDANAALTGIVPFTACRLDSRLSYTAYVPPEPPARPIPPTVVVHGSGRTAEIYRDRLVAYACRTGSVVIAPLFPCGLAAIDDTESYKFVVYRDIRFDLALLDMIAQMRARYPDRISADGILLHGFSGGGQFVHRFAYLHAEQILGLSVGAPGKVTLIDANLPWWRGLGGLSEQAGTALALEALRSVPVQLVIGARDTSEENVATERGSPHWMDGINDAGRNRMELISSLEDSWRAFGVTDLTVDVVPGVAHEGYEILDVVTAFLERVVEKRKVRGAGA